MVEFHPRFHAAPPHRPSAPWRASNCAPIPSVATRARSAATSSAGAPIRSCITCQRIEGSESSSHSMTDLSSCGACRLGRLVAIYWCSLLWLKDDVLSSRNMIMDRYSQHFAEFHRGYFAVFAKTMSPTTLWMVTEVYSGAVSLVRKRTARSNIASRSPTCVELMQYCLCQYLDHILPPCIAIAVLSV